MTGCFDAWLMTWERKPEFLPAKSSIPSMKTRSIRMEGLHGERDENALESAMSAAQNVYHHSGGDVYEIAVGRRAHCREPGLFGASREILRHVAMKVYFSDFFGVRKSTLKKYGAFNISLLSDLPLFIDPFLLFHSKKPKYRACTRA
jgi:hypothetical protein